LLSSRRSGAGKSARELCLMKLLHLFDNFRQSIAQKQRDRSRGPTITVSHITRSARASSASMALLVPVEQRQAVVARAAALAGADSSRAALLGETPVDGGGANAIYCMAEVPTELRERIKEEELIRIIRRLETPLRALHVATSRKGVEYPAEELRFFLLMWRQALGDYVGLLPDERSVLVYEPGTDDSYFVRGLCEPGSHLVVLESCWTLNGRVVVRGEARVLEDDGP
jgi:hypothetical protein